MDRSKQPAGRGKRAYFLAYTLCFLAACLLVFCWFVLDGRTFIWEIDGFRQHYTALVYYGEYLREAFKTLFVSHSLNIKGWEFAFGEGNSVLGTLHYYAIGDPLDLFAVFVPEAYMYLFFDALVIIRLYLAGIAFSTLCFQTGQRSRYAVLAGAMTYVFCYWALLCAARHPFFLNPMICLPLLVLGVEKLLCGQKPYVFLSAVCLSALSNFYFFYIQVVLIVIYVAARLCSRYRKDIRAAFCMLFRIGAYSVLGVLPAAVLLLPLLYFFLSDARMSAEGVWPLFYPKFYYSMLPSLFLKEGAGRWLCMGYSVPTFLAACLLVLERKKHGFLLLLYGICGVIIAFPACGKVLSAFSYLGNRWSFALALVAAYTLTAMWPSLMALNLRESLYLGVCTAAYLLACVWLASPDPGVFPYLAVLLILLWVLLLPAKWKGKPLLSARWKQHAAFACIFLSIFCNAYEKYVTQGYRSECLPAEKVRYGYPANESKAVKVTAKSEKHRGFYRYSGRRQNTNAGSIAGISSTDYYWSISNPSIAAYRKELDLLSYNLYSYKGYDDRAALLSLASVRYFAAQYKDTAPPPYGFSYLDTVRVKRDRKYKVYRNDHALPLAYAYDSYLCEEECAAMTGLQRQEAMLQAAILEGPVEGFAKASPVFGGVEVPYTLSYDKKEIEVKDDRFLVAAPGASLTLDLEGLADSETYLSLTGLDFYNPSQYIEQNILKIKASNGASKNLYYQNASSPRKYNGRHDFTANMGYDKNPVSSVTVTFSDPGMYTLDALKVICQPMDGYEKKIASMTEGIQGELKTGTDRVFGTISLESPKLLCISVPYDDGWSALVDGEPAKLYKANTKNMALALDAGAHTIELRYETPMLKLGAILSLLGLAAVAATAFLLEKKERGQQLKINRKE